MPAKATPQRTAPTEVVIRLPIGGPVEGYTPMRVDSAGLTDRQGNALKSLTSALRERNARYRSRIAQTENGLVVDKYADVIKFLLDQYADQLEQVNA